MDKVSGTVARGGVPEDATNSNRFALDAESALGMYPAASKICGFNVA
jgi:hypothetical protein